MTDNYTHYFSLPVRLQCIYITINYRITDILEITGMVIISVDYLPFVLITTLIVIWHHATQKN